MNARSERGRSLFATILVTAASLTPALAMPGTEPSSTPHAATFVTFLRTDTISVEHVRDVAGGYVGEILMKGNIPWIRYRVWTGPSETATRIDLDMTSMVGAEPGDVPMPLLTARRSRDSILVQPAEGVGAFPVLRKRVPRSALLSLVYTTASYEQAIRRARLLGTGKVTIPLFEPMNGQLWETTFEPLGGDSIRMVNGGEVWVFACDRQGRIQRGRYSGGLELVRVDPRDSLPVHRALTIPDSAGQVAMDARQARWERLRSVEAEFRSVLGGGLPPERVASAIDPLIEELGVRGGAFQAQLCVDVANRLREREGGLMAAERYARRAIACADTHSVLNYGDHGLLLARVASRHALAEIQFTLGERDSALRTLRGAVAIPRDYEEMALQRDLRVSLAKFLMAQGEQDQSIATWFESVALDPSQAVATAPPMLRRAWTTRFGDDADLDARVERARGRMWWSAMGGGQGVPRAGRAPLWRLPDLAGAMTSSTTFAGSPMVVVFWGSWTQANRTVLESADRWHRRKDSHGVQVVTMNWELPGPGPISAGLAQQEIVRHGYRVPVLLDHDQAVFKSFAGTAYPQVFFIDREGVPKRTVFGAAAASFDSLDAWVEALGGSAHR